MPSAVPLPLCKLPFLALSAVTAHLKAMEIFALLATSKNAQRLVSQSMRNFDIWKKNMKEKCFRLYIVASADHIKISMADRMFYIGNNIDKFRDKINYIFEGVKVGKHDIEINHRREEDVRQILNILRSSRGSISRMSYTNQRISDETFGLFARLGSRGSSLHVNVTNPHYTKVNLEKLEYTKIKFNGINISNQELNKIIRRYDGAFSRKSYIEVKGMSSVLVKSEILKNSKAREIKDGSASKFHVTKNYRTEDINLEVFIGEHSVQLQNNSCYYRF